MACALSTNFVGCARTGTLIASESRTVPGLNLTLQPIPAGTFLMGSPEDEPFHDDAESPQTRVNISQAFWLGKFAVTQGQWQALMSSDLLEQARRMLADDTLYAIGGKTQTIRESMGVKNNADPGMFVGIINDNYPMYLVSWDEAISFCRKLTERERSAGRLPVGYEYRLPTEAEWEYACRAGTSASGIRLPYDTAWRGGQRAGCLGNGV